MKNNISQKQLIDVCNSLHQNGENVVIVIKNEEYLIFSFESISLPNPSNHIYYLSVRGIMINDYIEEYIQSPNKVTELIVKLSKLDSFNYQFDDKTEFIVVG